MPEDAARREEIRALLAGGLRTQVFPRADTSQDFSAILALLIAARGDLKSKLVVAGFTPNPIMHGDIAQPCKTCMYYLIHRRYCALPELDLPVEPNWSCRLWRI